MDAATTISPTIQQPISLQVKAVRQVFGLLSKISPEVASRFAVRLFLTPNQRPYSAKALDILAEAQPVLFRHGSRDLQGYIWGDAAQPTILLVHGWEANAGAMRAFVPPLLAQGYCVIAFDAPAHGNSAGNSTTLYDYSGALQGICEAYAPIDGIISHSLGAVASLLMLGREAKLGVKKVVILGSPSNVVDIIRSWGEFLQIPRNVIARMRQRLVDRIGLPLDDQTVARSVANIAVPGLIIHDEHDSTVPFGNALAIHQHWSTASLTPTQGLDHLGILYNPETVELSVSFITTA